MLNGMYNIFTRTRWYTSVVLRAICTLLSALPLFWNFWKPGNVREFCKGQGKGTKSGRGQGICVVKDIWLWHLGIMPVMCMDTCSEHHITYLYCGHTTWMCFAYLMFGILTWVDFGHLLKHAPKFVTSRFCINKCVFVRDMLSAISSGKFGTFFCLESGNPVWYEHCFLLSWILKIYSMKLGQTVQSIKKCAHFVRASLCLCLPGDFLSIVFLCDLVVLIWQ